jgi:hypothetical protein
MHGRSDPEYRSRSAQGVHHLLCSRSPHSARLSNASPVTGGAGDGGSTSGCSPACSCHHERNSTRSSSTISYDCIAVTSLPGLSRQFSCPAATGGSVLRARDPPVPIVTTPVIASPSRASMWRSPLTARYRHPFRCGARRGSPKCMRQVSTWRDARRHTAGSWHFHALRTTPARAAAGVRARSSAPTVSWHHPPTTIAFAAPRRSATKITTPARDPATSQPAFRRPPECYQSEPHATHRQGASRGRAMDHDRRVPKNLLDNRITAGTTGADGEGTRETRRRATRLWRKSRASRSGNCVEAAATGQLV